MSSQKVRLVNLRLPVAELLEQFTDQTGVAFEARNNAWDDSGRWRVLCCLRDAVTVADAMEAVRSALSQKGATWSWRRGGVAPNYTYRFVRPAGFEKLAEANRAQVHRFFRREYEQAKRGFDMTPEQLKEAAKSDDTGMLAKMARHEHLREGLKALASNLSAKDLERVLSGGTVEVDLNQAVDLARSFAANRLAETEKMNGRRFAPLNTIEFAFNQMPIKHSPSLFICFDNLGGYAYLGGVPTERKWQAHFAAEARIEGDAAIPRDAEGLERKIMPPQTAKNSQPQDDPGKTVTEELLASHGAEEFYARLANAESPRINFVACLAQKNIINSSMSPVYGQTVAQLVKDMGERSIISKWRGDILVFRHTAGFASNDTVSDIPPYGLYKLFRDRLDVYAGNRQIPLADLVEMSRLGTPRQIEGLYEDYPEPFFFLMGGYITRPHAILRALSDRPDLVERMASEEGRRQANCRPCYVSCCLSLAEPPTRPGSCFARWSSRRRCRYPRSG